MTQLPRTEQLRSKIVAAIRKNGPQSISQLRVLTHHSTNAIEHVLLSSGVVDGISFVRVGEIKVRGVTAYLYDVTGESIAEREQTIIDRLDEMAKLAKVIGRLYRSGRRVEAMEKFKAWQELSQQIGQI